MIPPVKILFIEPWSIIFILFPCLVHLIVFCKVTIKSINAGKLMLVPLGLVPFVNITLLTNMYRFSRLIYIPYTVFIFPGFVMLAGYTLSLIWGNGLFSQMALFMPLAGNLIVLVLLTIDAIKYDEYEKILIGFVPIWNVLTYLNLYEYPREYVFIYAIFMWPILSYPVFLIGIPIIDLLVLG